ncbi:extensin family protein [Polyangium jinanense]|uniref:Extensin family protein n=1 Tax=Polyangium jinanense TaxID=2829994 RepID=A0A9X4AQI4_9BACT|nr:extensin family protein [Polyangium jinanense]MDC3980391.1 extensin family protein [Polyangium jinanense]
MLGSLLRSLGPSCLAALTFGAGMLCTRPASAVSPFLVTPDASVVDASPAYRYANMTDDEAFAELDKRSLPYVRIDPVPGVRAPVRLTGRLHGVLIHSALPEEQRSTSMFEILDARLALALDDFTAVLERHEIDELVHYTMYRPNVPREMPAPVVAKKAPAQREAPKKESAKKEAPKKETPKADAQKAEAPKAEAPKAEAPKAEAPKAETPKTGSKLPQANAAKASDLGKGALGTKHSEGATKGTKHKAPAAVQAKPREMVTASEKPKTAPHHAPKTAPHHAPAKAEAKAAPAKPEVQAAPAKTEPHAAPAKTVPHPRWAPPGTRHPAGLAIDVGRLRKKDGTWISVLDHFHGKIGEKTCGEGARKPEQPVAQELRALVCESQDAGIFTYVLSPNYNTDHADHFHMEIKPGVRWFLVH